MNSYRAQLAWLAAVIVCAALLARAQHLQSSVLAPSPAAGSSQSVPSSAPVAHSSGAPGRSSTSSTIVSEIKQIQDKTGIVFDTRGFESEIRSDGELQLKMGESLFIALMPMDEGYQAAFDSGLALFRIIGKDKLTITQPANEATFDAIKGTCAMGTVPIEGKTTDWYLAGLGSGKKSLRLCAIGTDLTRDKKFNDFMSSIKKQ